MCLIDDVQISGDQPFSVAGNPSGLEIHARVSDCASLRFDIFRNQGDAMPLFSASNRPVQSRIARAGFTVTADQNVFCGDVLWVEARCETDPTCFVAEQVRLVCKGFDDAEGCPAMGPSLSVQPAIDPDADCVPGGTYTITVGGTWPTGTTFNWSLTQNGQFIPQNEHGSSFVLQHPAGTSPTTVLAQVEVPGCPDVFSLVAFPEADEGDCPTAISIAVVGPLGPLPLPADGMTYAGLVAGDYQVVVTSPAPNGVNFEWYRDNVMQPMTIGSPEVLLVSSLAAGDSTTIAVRVDKECCNALLDTIILQTAAGGGTDPDDDPDSDPDVDPPVVDPPVVEPPSWPCLLLGWLVAIALVGTLVSIVVMAASGPLAILAFQSFVVAVIAAIVLAILLLLICSPGICRILQILAWALKWSIIIGVIIAIATFSLTAILIVIVYGMILAAIEWAISDNGCTDPSLFSLP